MVWEGWVTIMVVALFIVGLARNWTAPDVLSVACLVLLVAIGASTGSERLPTAGEALSGLENSGLSPTTRQPCWSFRSLWRPPAR